MPVDCMGFQENESPFQSPVDHAVLSLYFGAYKTLKPKLSVVRLEIRTLEMLVVVDLHLVEYHSHPKGPCEISQQPV